MSDLIDVLQVAHVVPAIADKLKATYHVHRASPGDTIAPDLAPKIRAIVAGGVAPASLLAQLPKLEIIASASVGYDGIGVTEAGARNIPVTHTPNVLNDDVADLAIALMVMTARGLATADKYVRDGQWVAKGNMKLARTVSGKKLGIVGLGRIGKDIARRAEAMNMTISYTNRRPVEGVPYKFVSSLLDLARDNDFIILIASAGPDATKMINKDVIEALGPDGILINVSRGRVVDEAALVQALKSGKLGGAALDVFEDEPNVPAELMAMDNVVLTPHLGSSTIETRTAMGQLALDNLAAWFAGRPLLTEVPETQAARRVAK
ncbi:MAG: 2-hydroxyacid dehydrogenase [Alphaproteobacteria bacterium]|nr:2-hydroxyacid dehydrogenase [Alphaproteobacteria bacterium]